MTVPIRDNASECDSAGQMVTVSIRDNASECDSVCQTVTMSRFDGDNADS